LHVINETVKNLLSLQESRNSKESIIYKHEMPAWDHETAFLLAYNHSRKNIDDLIKKVRKDYLRKSYSFFTHGLRMRNSFSFSTKSLQQQCVQAEDSAALKNQQLK